MPEWLWVLCLFLSLTIGYIIGFTCGVWKSRYDAPPTENAYIREAEIISADQKEIEIRKAEYDFQMRLAILKAEQEKEQRKWTQND